MASTIRPNRLPLWFKVGFAAALVLTLAMSSARAALIDPSTLQVGPGSTTDPVQVGNSGLLTVNQVSGGADLLTNPWLLILGIPETNNGTNNNFFNSADPITSVTTTNSDKTTSSQLGGNSINGGTWNSTTGYVDTMKAGQEAYTQMGFTGLDSQGNTNNSNSFTNWAGADSSINGITATGFDLYVFEISAALADKDTVSIQFPTGSLPLGTFAIAYGINSSHVYDTPFTEAGMTTGGGGGTPGGGATPAPPSVVLLGFGGLGLAFVLARSRRRLAAA